MTKDCIFICVFASQKYVEMLMLLLESIFIFGDLKHTTDILIYTSTIFSNMIKQSRLYNNTIKFEINDNYDDIDKACKARLDLFNLSSIHNYTRILYLDTDILIKGSVYNVFNIVNDDILYVLEEGSIENDNDHHGKSLFGNEISNYTDKSAFTSGILLFNNCEKIKKLFNKISDDIIYRPRKFDCYDQPYIVYNAFKYNLFNNKLLKEFAVNNDDNINSNKIIHHFPGGPGNYNHKIPIMINFLTGIKKCTVLKNNTSFFQLSEKIISNGFTLISKERLRNLYKACNNFKNTNYSFVECGVAKGGSLAMIKFASGKNNKIFGLDSFEGMPPITNEDIGDYNKSCPLTHFGKVGDNLSGGINNVYKTFNCLNLDMMNVNLIKGFFQDTLQIQENIDNIGEIAVLRLDGDWYESTKICLEKLYDKVIDGGIIIIDDYGHFIGAKMATDEFREKNNIVSPLIQTDYTEFFWIKSKSKSKTLNIYDDLWTCSDKMRSEIESFFFDKLHFKIAEIGSHKGYSTKILSNIFSKVYAVDNNVEFTNLNKKLNESKTNIEYIMLDIYKDSWEMLPDDIEISFIDADHSYESCKSDVINSLKKFKNLQYIIFDDYGVWDGVKQAVNEFLNNKTLIFERFIGLNDVPGPNEIIKNINEGIICRINKNIAEITNLTYSWEGSTITFLENFKIDAFGEGKYTYLDSHNIIAEFGNRKHNIKFEKNYSSFISIRNDDLYIVNGILIT